MSRISRSMLYFSRCFSSTKHSNMRFVQFQKSNENYLGIQKNNGDIIDVSGSDIKLPNNLVDYIRSEEKYRNLVQRIQNEEKTVYKLEEVNLLPPITKPDKIICVGLNYKDHCDEQNKPYPEEPFFFNKFPSTIVAPNGVVLHPSKSKALDWEVELAVIIGKKAKDVEISKAIDYVFGYTISQDISARDWQTPKRNNGQWLMAKSMDNFCPLGPAVVTKDDIQDPHNLKISCSVNGIEKQNANTDQLIHRIDKIVSYLSRFITLLPGDVILTGTPSGVGVFRNPKEFLKPGDVIESNIESIGILTNTIS